jgi:hypothetical protein
MIFSADFEECVPRRLCSWCSIIQIPTVTCRVRLRHRTKRSKVNQQSGKRKIKNEIVYHCLTCDRISSREEVCKKPLPVTPSSTPVTTPVATRAGSSSVDSKRDKKKFNFLEMLSQSRGTPPPAHAIAKGLSLGSGGLDFIPLVSSEGGGEANDRTPKKRVSLLELEENRKSNKKKRKSLGPQETESSSSASGTAAGGASAVRVAGGEGLGSLKSLFTMQGASTPTAVSRASPLNPPNRQPQSLPQGQGSRPKKPHSFK